MSTFLLAISIAIGFALGDGDVRGAYATLAALPLVALIIAAVPKSLLELLRLTIPDRHRILILALVCLVLLSEVFAVVSAASAYTTLVPTNAMLDDAYQGWYGPFIEEAAKVAVILVAYYKWTDSDRIPDPVFPLGLALVGGLTFGLIETFIVPKYAAVAGGRLLLNVPFHGFLTSLVIAGPLFGQRLSRHRRVGLSLLVVSWAIASFSHGAFNRAFSQPDLRWGIFAFSGAAVIVVMVALRAIRVRRGVAQSGSKT